jgi:hypothetical protein
MSLDSLDEVLSGGGAKSAFTKDSPLGTTVTGTILDANTNQIHDYMTGKPKTWDDGRPQMQIVVRIQTELRADADDDGVRGVYIKTWGPWKEALMAAIKAIGKSKPSEALVPGYGFTAQFSGTKPSQQGSDTKLYTYRIEPRAQAAVDQAFGAAPAQQAAPAVPTDPSPWNTPQSAPTQPSALTQAAAPAAPAGDPSELAAKARQMIALGLPDSVIAQNTGLSMDIIAAVRAAS